MEGMGSSARALRLGVAFLTALGLGACNLLTGASDLDIARGEPNPTPTGDAGASDSPPPTKEPNRDAGADADGGSPVSPCASANVFCDDFDGTPALAKWGVLKIGDATMVVDSVSAVSAPASLLMTYPATPGGNTVGAELSASTKLAPAFVSLKLAVRVEEAGESTDATPLSIVQLTLGTTFTLRLGLLRTGDAVLEEAHGPGGGGPPPSSTVELTQELDPGKTFSAIEIDVDLQGSNPAAAVKIDGKPAGTKNLSPPSTKEILGVAIGDRSVSGTGKAWKIRYDNVVLVAK